MKFLKILVFIISIIFLCYIIFYNYKNIQNNIIFDRPYIILEIFLLSILYAIFLFIIPIGWKSIIENLSKNKLSISLIWIWLKTNIYKYLPGNIFHYAGRQILAKKVGISHTILIKSNLIETLLMLITTLIISCIILILFYDFNMVNPYLIFLNKTNIYIASVLIIFILIFLNRYKNINIFSYINVILYYCIFFFGIGFIAYIILNYQMQVSFSYFLITAIYAFAWLVGFVTPGAPGGIGVRESIFVVFSNGLLSMSDALVLSMVLRISNIIGEIILFIIAEKMLIKYKKELE